MVKSSHHHKKKRNINGWNPITEDNIENLGNETAIYNWLHKKSASILSAKLERSSLWAAILSAISTAGTFSSILTQTFGNLIWLSITLTAVGATISLITTIILTVQKVRDYVGKLNKNKEAEQKYQWTNFKIQGQLQQPIEARENGASFFGWISYVINGISRIEDVEDDAIAAYAMTFNDSIPGIDGIRKIMVDPIDSDDCSYHSASDNPDDTPTERRGSSNRHGFALNLDDAENGIGPSERENTSRTSKKQSFDKSCVNNMKTRMLTRRDRIMQPTAVPPSARKGFADKRLQYEMKRSEKLIAEDDIIDDTSSYDSTESTTQELISASQN